MGSRAHDLADDAPAFPASTGQGDAALVERLAGLVQSEIGLKTSLLAPKIADALSRIEPLLRHDWVHGLMADSPGGRDWVDFVETLLVHETYFYRHPVQLDLLSEVVLPRLIAERSALGHRELRIWCAACATGEEVYTVALLAQDAIARFASSELSPPGSPPWSVQILGTDVSRSALAQAELGLYSNRPGLNSFRAVPPSARHHFALMVAEPPSTAAWSAPDIVRRTIRFGSHNLLESPAPECDADLVLCRNVLIYFEQKMLLRAESVVTSALRPGGFLLLGPADVLRQRAEFELISNDLAFAYRKLPSGASAGGYAFEPARAEG